MREPNNGPTKLTESEMEEKDQNNGPKVGTEEGEGLEKKGNRERRNMKLMNGLPPAVPSVDQRHQRNQRHRSPTPQLFGSAKKRCGPKLDTQERLFGHTAPPETPKKKVSDTFKSSIFSDSAPNTPVKTPKKCVPVLERNPITGEMKAPKKIAM